jgi:hypothetical protein
MCVNAPLRAGTWRCCSNFAIMTARGMRIEDDLDDENCCSLAARRRAP